MPFKLKLKKSRQYNVTSNIVRVYHFLDSLTAVECTLSADSNGQECLENACQRLAIDQTEFFGLRYIVKGSDDEKMRWIDLERPLSRQLEKRAASTNLYLRVMYYILLSGVTLITDEVTRYYYYLQLKSDVIEGKIVCDPKQAVLLSSYCRQAEYDSYQREKHTVDYFKTLFPKYILEDGLLETLTEEVLQNNNHLNNLSQTSAEEIFITKCQQLDGYGTENFIAKDNSGNEVTLGLNISGISVSGETYMFYPWRDISNVVYLKKVFNLALTVPEKNVGFLMPDSETGLYFWKLCVLQHTFHIYEQNQIKTQSVQNINLFQQNVVTTEDITDSRDYLDKTNNTNWNLSEQNINKTLMNSNLSLTNLHNSHLLLDQSWGSVPYDYRNRGSNWGLAAAGSNASLNNRAQSSSCLDLTNNNINNNNNNIHNNNNNNNTIIQESELRKAMLPTYRPAPDYDIAVQKYHSSTNELRMSNSHVAATTNLPISHQNIYVSGSHPDVYRATKNDQLIAQHIQQQQQQHYPDVTNQTPTANQIYPQQQQQQPIDTVQSYNNNNNNIDGVVAHKFKLMRLSKPPPPPYPVNRINSTSTPDLAQNSQRALIGYHSYVSGSSPDLVSTRNFGNHRLPFTTNSSVLHAGPSQQRLRYSSQNYLPQQQNSTTYEHTNNLIEQQQQQQNTKVKLLSQQIQKVYDGSNVIYCMPRDVEKILLQDQQNSTTTATTSLSSSSNNLIQTIINSSQHHINNVEPIYENVPLPWNNNNDIVTSSSNIRDRASSVQSAIGIMSSSNNSNDFPPPKILQHNLINDVNHTHHQQQQQQHRIIGKTISNPTLNYDDGGSTFNHDNYLIKKPPQQQQQDNLKKLHLQQQQQINTTTTNKNNLNDTSLLKNINRSQSTNVLDTTTSSSSSIHGSTTYTINDSRKSTISASSSTPSSSGSKEKRKRLWGGFLNRTKFGSSDKQKSATLGREKDKQKKINTTSNDDKNNIRHRWSTGLPKPQSLPTNISKEKLCTLLEAKLTDEQLFMEFEQIPKRKDNAHYDCALNDENKMKNFDPDFLPYDDNRVKITPTRDNRLGYVNASHITATVGNKQRFYIVAQSPQNSLTSNIFWQTVWEADVYLVIQLSDELKYVPKNNEKYLEFGQYQVWREFSQETDRCVTSKLRLYHTQNKRFRSIWHLCFLEWDEENCPKNVAHFLDFLEELNSVRIASITEIPPGHNTNPPVLIFCGEGGGRSGITLVSDLLLYTLDHNQSLNIPETVKKLREQRDNIIPFLAQYKYIYAILIHYLKQNRLI